MALKVKFRTLFPALVTVSSPLTLAKTGLAYAFGIDMDELSSQLEQTLQVSAGALPKAAQVRLTLTQGVPVTSTDVTGASTLYIEPVDGSQLSLYDGADWQLLTVPASSISVSNGSLSTNKVYDVFGYLSLGSLAIELVAWTDDTTRATSISQFAGVDVKSTDPTRRLLGTVRTDGSTQFHDSMAKRWVSNRYNIALREMKVIESTANWNYSTLAWRQFNNNAANQLDFVSCMGGSAVEAEVLAIVANSTSTVRGVSVGIGLDGTTSVATLAARDRCDNVGPPTPLFAKYRGYPGAGRHYLTALEYGAGSDTQTWFSFTANELFQGGICGSVWG